MIPLKLLALDAEDLAVISAHVQDAVCRVGDLDYASARKQFGTVTNRFAWESGEGGLLSRRRNERRRSVLSFGRVLAIRTAGIDRGKPDDVLSLLAVRFHETQAPAGTIELLFAGTAAIRLDVECIEARLADLGAAWEAVSRPLHRV